MIEGIDNAYPLSPMQQGMLYEILKNPASDIYVAYIAIDIVGKMNPDTLRLAWDKTVVQHETLRTRFLWHGLDEPLQLVNSDVDLDWKVCADTAAGEIENSVRQWVEAQRQIKLEISDVPPMRLRLFRISEDFSVLIWVVHHLLADDWSTPLVLRSVAEHYQNLVNAPEIMQSENTAASTPSFEYVRYIDWLQKLDQKPLLDYWTPVLAQLSPTPIAAHNAFKVDAGPGPEWRHEAIVHNRFEATLSKATSDALLEVCRSYSITLSTLMHVAWGIVLSRYTGSKRVVFGTSVAGRSCPLVNVDSAVGLFLNTLPTQIDTSFAGSVQEFCQSVQQQLFEHLKFEHLSLAEMSKQRAREYSDEMFESVLVIESHGPELSIDVENSAISFGNIRYFTDSNYPLTALIFPATELQIHLVYDTTRFEHNLVAAISAELQAALKALCNSELVSIQNVKENLRQNTQEIYSRDVTPSVHYPCFVDEWIDCHADSDAWAVVDATGSFTYKQLSQSAGGIAQQIMLRDAPAGTFVGICLAAEFMQIAAIYGVLKSGCAYVPLDPEWPNSRLCLALQDANISIIVTTRKWASRFTEFTHVIVIEDCDSISSNAEFNTVAMRAGKQPAYMIFTSGSTGRAKGVPISHENLIYSTRARIDYYTETPERYMLLSSYAFDSSVAGIFWTLCTGGTLVLPHSAGQRDVAEIEALVFANQITHTLCLPSLYALLLRYSEADRLGSLCTVIVAGEACHADVISQHRQALPHTDLYNEYGPTEATVWATVSRLHRREAEVPYVNAPKNVAVDGVRSVPIGEPIPGTRIEIVNQHRELCPQGIAGEIKICSDGVAMGYHHDSTLSSDKFEIENGHRAYYSGDLGVLGFDNQLYFMGRIDSQLSVRGHRVEPGEIESRLCRHPAVAQAVCVLTPIGNHAHPEKSSKQLVCYFTLSAGILATGGEEKNPVILTINDPELRQEINDIRSFAANLIADELPAHFRVSQFIPLTQIPLLPNGKIDVTGLPSATASSNVNNAELGDLNASQGNTPPLVSALCELVGSVLGQNTVHAQDSFFSLGGDSLNAIRLVAAARERNIAISIPMLGTANSITELAQLSAEEAKQPKQEKFIYSAHDTFGETPLTPIQRWYFSANHPKPAHWNMACVVELKTPVHSAQVVTAIERYIAVCPSLFTQFREQNNQLLQVIPQTSLQKVEIVQQDSSNNDEAVIEILSDRQSDFDLRKGELCSFIVLEDSQHKCERFCWVIHHLVTDAISNGLIADHIVANIFQDPATPVPIQDTGPSFRHCALAGLTQNQAEAVTVAGALPNYPWLESNADYFSVPITADTMTVLTDICQAGGMRIPETLLYLLLTSASRVYPTDEFRVDVETHGRDRYIDFVDISNVVGWFSDFYALIASRYSAPPSLTAAIQFSKVFNRKGSHQMPLFSDCPESFFAGASAKQNQFNFLYNFLAIEGIHPGRDAIHISSNKTDAEGGFEIRHLINPAFRDTENRRSHAIEIQVVNEQDQLLVFWQVDNTCQFHSDISHWQHEFKQDINAFVTQNNTVKLNTQSAFIDSGMEHDELAEFLESLE